MRGPELDTNAAESPSSVSLSINIITPKNEKPLADERQGVSSSYPAPNQLGTGQGVKTLSAGCL